MALTGPGQELLAQQAKLFPVLERLLVGVQAGRHEEVVGLVLAVGEALLRLVVDRVHDLEKYADRWKLFHLLNRSSIFCRYGLTRIVEAFQFFFQRSMLKPIQRIFNICFHPQPSTGPCKLILLVPTILSH